jgi:hypothetical protein
MSNLITTPLKWRRLSADAYEANGTGHWYAVINIGNPSGAWLATGDGPHQPRPEHSLSAAMGRCERWAQAYDIYLNGDNDDDH